MYLLILYRYLLFSCIYSLIVYYRQSIFIYIDIFVIQIFIWNPLLSFCCWLDTLSLSSSSFNCCWSFCLIISCSKQKFWNLLRFFSNPWSSKLLSIVLQTLNNLFSWSNSLTSFWSLTLLSSFVWFLRLISLFCDCSISFLQSLQSFSKLRFTCLILLFSKSNCLIVSFFSLASCWALTAFSY